MVSELLWVFHAYITFIIVQLLCPLSYHHFLHKICILNAYHISSYLFLCDIEGIQLLGLVVVFIIWIEDKITCIVHVDVMRQFGSSLILMQNRGIKIKGSSPSGLAVRFCNPQQRQRWSLGGSITLIFGSLQIITLSFCRLLMSQCPMWGSEPKRPV